MSLQSLSVFIAVAEEENFTSAAKKLNLTQPTVSFHMDNLEKSLGCPLFNRTSKGATLTPYGKRLYESVSKVDSALRTAYNEISRMAEGNAGHIYIGASTIPGEYILPEIISSFITSNPGINFNLTTGNSRYIIEEFLSGRFAAAVVGIKPPDMNAAALWDDEVVLVAHPQLADEFQEVETLLRSMPLILRAEPSGSRQAVVEALTKAGIQEQVLTVVLEVTGNQALKSAILHRAGIGFISRWAVREELINGRLKIIHTPGLEIRRTFYLITNPRVETEAVRRFVDYLVAGQVK